MKNVLLVVLFLVIGLGTVKAQDGAPRTGIFVLVDVSETWLNPAAQGHNSTVLAQMTDAVLDLSSKVETPIAIFVGTIGADSLLQRPVCEATFRRTLISVKARAGEFVTKEKLRNHLELCNHAVLNRPVAKWTDIHGALDLVGRAAATANYSHKYLLILSDMKEETPKTQQQLGDIDLHGFRTALIYRILPEDSAAPAKLNGRLAAWSALLSRYGATRTVPAMDKTRFSRDLVAKLLEEK